MRSVQIHKTPLLFPSYIFFQRSITHRPWQPPLDESTVVLAAKLGCPLARCPGSGHSPNIFQQKGEKLPGSRKEAGKVESIARCGGNCLRRKESRQVCFSVMETVGLSLPNPAACHHSVVGDILENASLVRSKGAFSTSPVSLGQRPANPASVLQCPPDRRGVRSGLFMDETPLKGTTGYLPPVSPPYNGHTAQLYTMRGLHNTDTQYSESIQHGHVNSSHQ